MYRIYNIIGNVSDVLLRDIVSIASIDIVEVPKYVSSNDNIKIITKKGNHIVLSLDNDTYFKNGDILFWDSKKSLIIVCKVVLCNVLVIDLKKVTETDQVDASACCFTLGYELGNLHLPLVMHEKYVFIPLYIDKQTIEKLLYKYNLHKAYSVFPGEEVVKRFDLDRLQHLFGAGLHMAGAHACAHQYGHGHVHAPLMERPQLSYAENTKKTPYAVHYEDEGHR